MLKSFQILYDSSDQPIASVWSIFTLTLNCAQVASYPVLHHSYRRLQYE